MYIPRRFHKIAKKYISFVMSVRPSARNEQLRRIFKRLDMWAFFEKSVKTPHVQLKYDTNNEYFTFKTHDYL